MKTYVLMISERFPKNHPEAGKPTKFPESIKNYDKIHTIRSNYDLWRKRFENINKGKAILSVRIWSGKPYRSKQIEIFRYDIKRKIGIQKMNFDESFENIIVNGKAVNKELLAKNDGLNPKHFDHWFKDADPQNPMVIIHFTDFRYKK